MNPVHFFLKKSTRDYIDEAKKTPSFSFSQWVHGYIYGRWVYQYISIGLGEHRSVKLFKPILNVFLFLRGFFPAAPLSTDDISFSDTYHGKVIHISEAKKLVTINREIKIDDLEQVIPYKRARSIILKNPDHIVALECPCRAARRAPCFPLDVCLIIGEPFASFVHEHHKKKSRYITESEALTIVEQEHERGHVQHAFFKDAMLNRFYAICNCCGCCCGAIQALNNGTPMLASSGFIATIDINYCKGCGICEKFCQFNAIKHIEQESFYIDEGRCLGCGVCVEKCSSKAITLSRDETKGIPLEIESLIGNFLEESNATNTHN